MKSLLLYSVIILIIVSCNSVTKQKVTYKSSGRVELLPESDKQINMNSQSIQEIKKTGCEFNNPDTSISGIIIDNVASATKIIGNKNMIDSFYQYHFYTKHGMEMLTLTQHPGSVNNQISVFKAEYSDTVHHNYKQLPIDILTTEKGIRLGLTKQQIVDRLGNCCAILDSGKNYIKMYYRIEMPNDSKTELLASHNMPIYSAWYLLENDKLISFEFGFENP